MSDQDNLVEKIDSLIVKVTRLEYAVLIILCLIFIFFALSLHFSR